MACCYRALSEPVSKLAVGIWSCSVVFMPRGQQNNLELTDYYRLVKRKREDNSKIMERKKHSSCKKLAQQLLLIIKEVSMSENYSAEWWTNISDKHKTRRSLINKATNSGIYWVKDNSKEILTSTVQWCHRSFSWNKNTITSIEHSAFLHLPIFSFTNTKRYRARKMVISE